MGKTDNIILIGFMGTQKTSAGRMLAQLTEREFVDMDNMIEQRAGMRIRELFERFGEEAFREREEALAQELGSRQGLVVSTGGGVVLREATMAALTGVRVLLACDQDELWRRIGGDEDRPVLKRMDFDAMVELLEKRRPYYRRYAQLTVDTTGKQPELTARHVLSALEQWEKGRRGES